VRIICYSETVSPITHMAGVVGNEAIIKREQLASGQWVPSITGNALRHRCVRETGARYLVDALGLSGELSLPQLAFLFNGGSLTESTGREDTKKIADLQRLFPLLRLLGGSLPDQILSGTLIATSGLLVCEENRSRLSGLLPDEWSLPVDRLRDAEAMVGTYQYVRGVPTKTCPDLVRGEDELDARGAGKDGKSQQMIFSGQCVNPGAAFVHGFLAPSSTALDIGCLLHSLALWQQAGGTVGGSAAKGHGRLSTYVHCDQPIYGCVERYQEHVEQCKQECVDWLTAAFAKKKAA